MAVVLAFALYNVALDPDEQLGLMSAVSFRSGLVLSLAARLFPVLSRDAHQSPMPSARAAWSSTAVRAGERAAARLPLLGALLTRSLERAVDVAAAMEARGYGSARRSRWLASAAPAGRRRGLGGRWRPGRHSPSLVGLVTGASPTTSSRCSTTRGRSSPTPGGSYLSPPWWFPLRWP